MLVPAGFPSLPFEPKLDTRLLEKFPLPAFFEEAMDKHGFLSMEDVATYLLFHSLPIPMGNALVPMQWIPGNRNNPASASGPFECRVMVIGKMPGSSEVLHKRNFVGESGRLLRTAAQEAGVQDFDDWYVTNVVRYPCEGGTLAEKDVANCAFLLAQEIQLVKPNSILLLGADAVKAVFGRKATLQRVRSSVYTMLDPLDMGAPLKLIDKAGLAGNYGIKVFSTIHPAAVLKENGLKAGFFRDMQMFKSVLENKEDIIHIIHNDNYKVVEEPEQLAEVVTDLLVHNIKRISVDCEWGFGNYRKGTLRTIQFSWEAGHACVVKLCGPDCKEPDPIRKAKFCAVLRELVADPKMTIIGHNLRADAKWLEDNGVPILSGRDPKYLFDTMLADHILNENAEHGLDACAIRYTDMGRYDAELSQYCESHGLNTAAIKEFGFSGIPDEILLPYAACDADATFRIADVLSKRLALRENAKVAACFYGIVMPCMYPIHEIETTGLLVDMTRMGELIDKYGDKKEDILRDLRKMVKNPSFNPRSTPQKQKLLFGPVDLGGLELTPIKTTERPARLWEDLQPADRAKLAPSTDSESLEALATENPIASTLRDFSLVDQVTKSFLRKQKLVDGYMEEDGGLAGAVDEQDGRIRTSINQMSETGRWKSSDPNLQNLPKKQDKEHQRIMGKGTPKIRSCFLAAPGCVLIEADYKSAEVFTLGYLANDERLIRDAFCDIHSRGAVTRMGAKPWPGFDTWAPPPEEWKEEYKSLRVASKTITFGIPYQRGAKAIGREIEKSTKGEVKCDKARAQEMIDAWYEEYSNVRTYVTLCQVLTETPGWLENPYGRRRRFISHENDSALAAQQREAVNFPIQSTVADTLNVAMYNLFVWRMLNRDVRFKILLAVHDAALLEVPGEFAEIVIKRALPECMTYGAVVPSWKPWHTYPTTKPFTLDIDVEVGVRWGEKVTADELRARNVNDWVIGKFAKH